MRFTTKEAKQKFLQIAFSKGVNQAKKELIENSEIPLFVDKIIKADVERKMITPIILKVIEHRSLPLVIEPHKEGEKPPLQRDFNLTDSEHEMIMGYLNETFGNHEVKPQ